MEVLHRLKKSLGVGRNHLLTQSNKIRIGLYHLKRSLKYSSDQKKRNGWIASMRMKCHVLEKGLTMPNTRFCFGQPRITGIIEDLRSSRQYEKEEEYQYAIGLLKEYLDLHDRNNIELPSPFRSIIEELTNQFPDIKPLKQIEITEEEYFSHVDEPFPGFDKSRRTVRYFEKAAPLEDIKEAMELAVYAPSACNRQSVKCHFYEGAKVQEILKVQTGNNGFGHLAPQLIILTSDASMIASKEYNDSYTNAGIFAMNLSYALYYKKIASCILNWSVLPKDDKALRIIADIPKEETIVLIMVLGKTPEKFKIAVSKRQQVKEFFINHNALK